MFASAVAVDPSRTQHAALDAAAAAGHGVRAQAYADGCGWALDEDKFKNFDTMTVNHRVTLNSLDIPRATALGAFVNEQLRGLTEDPMTPPFGPFQGKLIHPIKIYGLPGEKIEYRLCTGLFFSRVFNDVRNNTMGEASTVFKKDVTAAAAVATAQPAAALALAAAAALARPPTAGSTLAAAAARYQQGRHPPLQDVRRLRQEDVRVRLGLDERELPSAVPADGPCRAEQLQYVHQRRQGDGSVPTKMDGGKLCLHLQRVRLHDIQLSFPAATYQLRRESSVGAREQPSRGPRYSRSCTLYVHVLGLKIG
jgi:hypothetical protein